MNIDEIKKELKDTKRQIGSLEDRARKLRNVLRKIEPKAQSPEEH